MLGDLPACTGFGVGSMIARYGPDFPFARCTSSLRGADIVFGNLEVVMSAFNPKHDPFHSTHLRAQPAAMAGLRNCGFNVLSLANNHIMQHGHAAVLETVEILRREGITFTGVEDQKSDICNLGLREVAGRKIGFLGYNFRPPQYHLAPPIDVAGSDERILADIEKFRNSVDWLVLSLHWGEEFVTRPSAQQVRQARSYIDAGAHLILGHHPHILQGIERYGRGLIAYSLGDFVFDLWQRRLRESMILHVNLTDSADITFEIEPVVINRRWQPEPMVEGEAAAVRKRIERLAGQIDADLNPQEYERLVSDELARFRREVYWHYATSLHRFGVRRFWENLKGVLGRRLGSRRQSY